LLEFLLLKKGVWASPEGEETTWSREEVKYGTQTQTPEAKERYKGRKRKQLSFSGIEPKPAGRRGVPPKEKKTMHKERTDSLSSSSGEVA